MSFTFELLYHHYSVTYRLQVVIINRLVLSLCHADAANTREDSEFRTRTGLEPPTFATGPILGKIGGAVRAFPDELNDEMLDGEEMPDADEDQGETTELPSANGAGDLNSVIEFRHDIEEEDV